MAVRALLARFELECACQNAKEAPALVFVAHIGVVSASTPASQTLIVFSPEPETIVLPSGEYATEVILSLWALSLVALSSSVAAKQQRRRQLRPRIGILWGKTHLHPRL